MMINNEELPIGFTMELAQHSDSLIRFSNMNKSQQDAVISGAKEIKSREDMRHYVEQLSSKGGIDNEPNRFY